jgi:hypothetical protein
MSTTYQVVGWDQHFEGAKSKTYSNKTSCQMPTKHGLGYRRMVRSKNGAAMFGAWCALIQVLSRHSKPRHGYCTDTGRIPGRHYTADDLECLTDIPSGVFAEMLKVASSDAVGWLKTCENIEETGPTDTMRIPCGYHADTTGSLDSDLDSDSNSDSDSDSSEPQAASEPDVPPFIFIPIVGDDEGFPIPEATIAEFESLYPAVDVRQTLREIRGWNLANKSRRKTARGVMRHVNSWMTKEQNGGKR